jgi:hypothetical protein
MTASFRRTDQTENSLRVNPERDAGRANIAVFTFPRDKNHFLNQAAQLPGPIRPASCQPFCGEKPQKSKTRHKGRA